MGDLIARVRETEGTLVEQLDLRRNLGVTQRLQGGPANTD